jgi:hypothetical protein
MVVPDVFDEALSDHALVVGRLELRATLQPDSS